MSRRSNPNLLEDKDTTSVNTTEGLVSKALHPRSCTPWLVSLLSTVEDGKASKIAGVGLFVGGCVVVSLKNEQTKQVHLLGDTS